MPSTSAGPLAARRRGSLGAPSGRPRRRRPAVAAASALVVLALVGGYAAADAADVVPGPLTTAPPPDPDPWPQAPGAVLPDAVLPGAGSPDDERGQGVAPVLGAAGTAAPLPAPASLAAVLDPLLGATALGPAHSAVVTDPLTGEVLLDESAGTPRQPASTVKLLTGAAALVSLGGSTTLPTTVVLALQGAGGPPEAVLVAGGDVLLGAGAGDPDAVAGRAGLADLADEVASSLAARGEGAVALRLADPLAPSGPVRPGGWSPGDVSLGYAADVTGVAVDAGRLSDEEYALRSPDPALAAAGALADLLRARGVDVVGDVARTDPRALAEDAAVLGEVRSAPLAEVVGHVLRVSDNTGAEALGLLVARASGAPVTPAGAAQAVTAAVADLGVDVGATSLADVSGLGEGSGVPATVLTGVLGAAVREDDLRPVLEGLPVAGLTGSLAGRLGDEPAARGQVRAKTGTLTGVSALAGVTVDADGRLLAFAVLADEVPATDAARGALDDVAAVLAGCGCR